MSDFDRYKVMKAKRMVSATVKSLHLDRVDSCKTSRPAEQHMFNPGC